MKVEKVNYERRKGKWKRKTEEGERKKRQSGSVYRMCSKPCNFMSDTIHLTRATHVLTN